MMRRGRMGVTLCLAVGFLGASGCYTSRHYSRNPSQLDYVFFGTPAAAGPGRSFQESKEFRNYFLFGLIPASEGDVRFAAEELAIRRMSATRIEGIEITTKKSFLNGLAEVGIAFIPIFGILGPFLFNFRSIELEGRALSFGRRAAPGPAHGNGSTASAPRGSLTPPAGRSSTGLR